VVVDQWFGRTVIYSDQRFAYEEAQYIIETKDNTMPEEISISGNSYVVSDEIDATLKMNQLAIFRSEISIKKEIHRRSFTLKKYQKMPII
jgi:ribonuclease R